MVQDAEYEHIMMMTGHPLSSLFTDSDIIFLNVAGRGVIVLDSSEAAIELLERRSSIYSGRPAMPMIHDVVQCDFNFGFLPYGK